MEPAESIIAPSAMSRCSRASWEAWSGCAGDFEKLAEIDAWDWYHTAGRRIDFKILGGQEES